MNTPAPTRKGYARIVETVFHYVPLDMADFTPEDLNNVYIVPDYDVMADDDGVIKDLIADRFAAGDYGTENETFDYVTDREVLDVDWDDYDTPALSARENGAI